MISNKNEIPRTQQIKNFPFKVSDNEIYMIKESSIKRIHDVMKNSYIAKPNPDCNVRLFSNFQLVLNKDSYNDNENLVDSMRSTIQNFECVFEIDNIKNYYDEKLEEKYQ